MFIRRDMKSSGFLKKEFEKNPKTYTLDEIEAELKMDGGENETDRCGCALAELQ